MELEEALALTHARPPATEREPILREHLAAMRRDFEGHALAIGRIDAVEAGVGKEKLPPDLRAAREESKKALDVLAAGIGHTLEELRKLDPDAD